MLFNFVINALDKVSFLQKIVFQSLGIHPEKLMNNNYFHYLWFLYILYSCSLCILLIGLCMFNVLHPNTILRLVKDKSAQLNVHAKTNL